MSISNPDPANTLEEWRDVPGYRGLYAVSSHGRVRSADRLTKNRHSSFIRQGRVLKTPPNKDGYPECCLHMDGVQRKRLVHQLVLEVFVGPRPDGLHACHGDGIPGNCHLGNLRWDTPRANMADALAHGVIPFGEQRPQAKLTEAEVLHIHEDARTQKVIAAVHGVTQSHISRLKSGQRWAHLQGERSVEVA